MKGLYWRPRKTSRLGLLLIAGLAIGGLLLVERWPLEPPVAHRDQMLAGARLAERGMDLIKRERQRRGHTFNPHFDPGQTGMIGESMSLVTSVPGNLRSKQTSVNPNFAAAVVQMLRRAGVERGDVVAVGCSGSFPALNLATYAALETVGAEPLIVASVGASQFGANMPDLLWIDMERLLHDEGLISFRSLVASPGGYEDEAMGMGPESLRLIDEGLKRNGLPLLSDDSLPESIESRMRIYRRHSAGRPIAAYINVGGGAASVGRTAGKQRYRPGLNLTPPRGATEIDSVMTRFAKAGTPLIHLVEANELAASLGLPEAPPRKPEVGSGGVYQVRYVSRLLALLVLVALALGFRMVVFRDAPGRLRAWLDGLRPRRDVPPRLQLVGGPPAPRAGVEEELMV